MDVIMPFSGWEFFILGFSFIAILHLLKSLLVKVISYKNLMFLVIVLYIYFLMPKDFKEASLYLLGYMYLVYTIFTTIKIKIPLFIPMLIVALPMILFKLDISPIYKIIGISYITFRVIQAIVDSENFGKLNIFEFTSFIYFPTTLLAGPIDRSYRFQEDLNKGYANLTLKTLGEGWDILILGVLFKFVLADLINIYWLSEIDMKSIVFLDMANNAYAYTTYLFFDFAGYSAMAVGMSMMMGVHIPINFNHPYLAISPQDFWRRFHITLGAWLTDYFFKPIYKYLHSFKILKGKRLLIQNISIMATFLLMGSWNGFTWYYIFSGFLFGLYSVMHNTYVIYVRKGGFDIFTSMPEAVSINFKRFLMINAAVFALYFFSGRVPI